LRNCSSSSLLSPLAAEARLVAVRLVKELADRRWGESAAVRVLGPPVRAAVKTNDAPSLLDAHQLLDHLALLAVHKRHQDGGEELPPLNRGRLEQRHLSRRQVANPRAQEIQHAARLREVGQLPGQLPCVSAASDRAGEDEVAVFAANRALLLQGGQVLLGKERVPLRQLGQPIR